MIYQLFIIIMDFLTHIFGYIGALRIKDILDNLAWGIILAIPLFWVMAHALLELYKSNTVEKEVAVQRVEFEGVESLQMNPTSAWEAIEVFLGYIILKLSPTEDIRFRTLKPLRVIIFIIMIMILTLGIFLSLWDYFPDGYTPPLKQVGCVTNLNDPTVGYPIHLKLSSLPPALDLATKNKALLYSLFV